MAKKIKLTRPELKRQREMLHRFERYLPMLKLKQQQLQLTLREIKKQRQKVLQELADSKKRFDAYRCILADTAGMNIPALATPEEVSKRRTNVAGVNIPVFDGVTFPKITYSLFATPQWVDKALADFREVNTFQAEADVLQEQFDLLDKELTKIIQRVNLFEKIMIPQCREIIRVIRIKLGDEMTAAVGRAKIAKGKISEEGTGENTDVVYESATVPSAQEDDSQ